MVRVFLTLMVTLSVCSGCTTVISEQSRKLIDTEASFSEIRTSPETYIGKHLLLGGQIANIRNNQSGAQLEIVQFEVSSSGAPQESYVSYGRFIATTMQYIEPLIYRPGMMITLVGELKGKETRRLDDMDYTYPVIAMREWYLWPGSEPDSRCLYPPSPMYDPYYFGYGFEPFLPRPFPVYLPR